MADFNDVLNGYEVVNFNIFLRLFSKKNNVLLHCRQYVLAIDAL